MKDILSKREMKKVMKDQKSEWCSVKSGVPQGSILVMFLVYVNNITEGVNSYKSLFVDDARLLRKLENKEAFTKGYR